MKLRIKFSKEGSMKFIGHLDMMRYFQKAIRRANIDICYSEGFSPHQVMSFASPLGVGLTSRGEYFDIEVKNAENSDTLVRHLNDAMADGVVVLSVRRLEDSAKNCMSIVAAADYTVTFRPSAMPKDVEIFRAQFLDFYRQNQITILKKTKKSEKEIDIKPMIYEVQFHDDSIFLKLAAGSINNLKPELVLEAYYQYLEQEYPEFAFCIQREEVYAEHIGENGSQLVTLEALGEYIE